MEISELQRISGETAKASGWHDTHRSFGEDCALFHSEISEALEAYRAEGFKHWGGGDWKPEGVFYELADCVIRICDFFYRREVDLEYYLRKKQEYNKTRPYRHGGKKL
jgi:hypothetical protein